MAITNATQPTPHATLVARGETDLSSQPLQRPTDTAPQADDLMHRVVRGAHDTIDRLAEHAAPQLAQLGDSLSTAGEALHGKADEWRATGDVWAESLRGTVRDNPLAALAAALAVGVLIARITR